MLFFIYLQGLQAAPWASYLSLRSSFASPLPHTHTGPPPFYTEPWKMLKLPVGLLSPWPGRVPSIHTPFVCQACYRPSEPPSHSACSGGPCWPVCTVSHVALVITQGVWSFRGPKCGSGKFSDPSQSLSFYVRAYCRCDPNLWTPNSVLPPGVHCVHSPGSDHVWSPVYLPGFPSECWLFSVGLWSGCMVSEQKNRASTSVILVSVRNCW